MATTLPITNKVGVVQDEVVAEEHVVVEVLGEELGGLHVETKNARSEVLIDFS